MKALRTALVLTLLLFFSHAADADMQKANSAYGKKEYRLALAEYLKLAQADAAAQPERITAQYMLGVMHANGEGIPQDYSEAVSWYYLAAQQGHAGAQNNLGVMYYRGRGVPANLIRAYKWLSLASAGGDTTAAANSKVVAAHMTPKQLEQAQSFVDAARQGNVKAQFDLGVKYANGRGVSRDYREAASWYYLAAQQGYANAQNNLGLMYYRGLGVPANLIQAYKWLSLAGTAGYAAAANRKMVAARMTPLQIKAAQVLASDWRALHKNALSTQTQDPQTAKDKPPTSLPSPQHATARPLTQQRTASRNAGNAITGAQVATETASAAGGPRWIANAVQDLSLERAIAIARETSFRLGRSQRLIDGSVARYNAATTLYRPRFDSTAYATESKHLLSQVGALGQVPQFIGGLNLGVTQPLDIGGVIEHQVTQADLARRAAEFDLAQSYLDVSLEVAINYYSALRAQEIMRVDQGIVRDLEHLVKEIGESPGGINSFIQVELANARQTFTASYTIFDLSFETLKQSLRLPPGTMIRLTDGFNYGPVAVADLDNAQTMQETLARRPDISQIGVRIEQTRLAAEQVDDSRKPTLSLQLFSNNAYYSRSPGSAVDAPLTYDRGAMVTLNIPLAYFDWGYLNQTKKSILLQNEQAKFDQQEQLERAGLEVRQAMIALKRAEQRVKTLPDLALAHDTLSRAEHDYLAAANRTDPATLAQMSNARASSRLAETVTIDALYEYNVAMLNLKHAIGGARPPLK